MYKELDHLKERVDKLISLRRVFYMLRSETHQLTEEFLQKYNTYNSDIKFGDLRSYLTYAMDKGDLIYFLEKLNGEIDPILNLMVNLNKLKTTTPTRFGLRDHL